MRVSLALLFASYPFFFSFLLLAADAASDPISHILFDASVAAFLSPRREGKRLVKAKIRKGINRLSVKFEYFFPPRFAGQKRERERKIRNKNATRIRLIPALLLEAENKPRQRG